MPRKRVAVTEEKLPAPEEVEESSPSIDPEALYVTKEVHIDKHTTHRFRVKVTPSVCDDCGFDVLTRNGIKTPFDELDAGMQAQTKDAIREHKVRVHDPNEHKLLKGSQLRRSHLKGVSAFG